MYHGVGAMRGLGAAPTCITDAERAEAASLCRQGSQIRGLGSGVSLGPMSGRLAAYAACDVLGLPTCPPQVRATPKPIEPPTRSAPPPAAPPPPPPPLFAPPPSSSASASTMGIFSILALVAAAGGGFYLYRRYKR